MSLWVRVIADEPDTNAIVLDENDPWPDACQHILDGGEYTIAETEYDDPY
jgi:hypothetical protein